MKDRQVATGTTTGTSARRKLLNMITSPADAARVSCGGAAPSQLFPQDRADPLAGMCLGCFSAIAGTDSESDQHEDANPKQRTLRLLRAYRDKLLQRFSSLDRAYLGTAIAGSNLTRGGFMTSVRRLGYSPDDASAMFEHIVSLVPWRSSTGLKRGTLQRGHQRGPWKLTQQNFVRALQQLVPVRSLVQLRSRLQERYGCLHLAANACIDHGRGVADVETFRDFLCGVGVTAAEANALFPQVLSMSERPD
eukprot:CAMPEP_0168402974 /NCGR_PEP_ID=MMETSP0228-20121227/23890_1 /TAXON_ID=133427 /ORGANISM="Protoceratium reticulatum, Strain CCCM 535 (=CCMP 1889)" /LENGTH=249 /DNA_ID=CAMNT_0008416563 /DNA_START=123 /DNA_END=869 /DNA_ORIENTATION=-